MRNVYGYLWGIWWWRVTKNADSFRESTNLENSLPEARNLQAIRERGAQTAWNWGAEKCIPNFVPVDVVLRGRVPHVRATDVVLHQWQGFVPYEGVITLSETSAVCSPEFCYLQVASSVRTIVREQLESWQYAVILIELGCELCGLYAKQNNKRGYKKRLHSLTTTSKIWKFLVRMGHEYGAPVLCKAMTWVIDGLRSPMETCLYLLLCLPTHMGGAGLPAPLANPLLKVPKELWGKTKLRHIIPDLFWPEYGLMVEYDSDEQHENRVAEDQERRELAQEMGYAVVTVRLRDMEDISKLRTKMESIARRLNRSLPASTTGFLTRQKKLRDMLVFHERWI